MQNDIQRERTFEKHLVYVGENGSKKTIIGQGQGQGIEFMQEV